MGVFFQIPPVYIFKKLCYHGLMKTFAVAFRIEAENCKQTLYQDVFTASNKHEALGKALETFIRGGAVLEFSIKQVDSKDNSIPLSSLDNEIIKLTKLGRKIEAIKYYRQQTLSDLRTAKDYVEKVMLDNDILMPWRP